MEVVLAGSPLDLYLHSLLSNDDDTLDHPNDDDKKNHTDNEREERNRLLREVQNASYHFHIEEEEEEEERGKEEREEGMKEEEERVKEEVFDILWANFLEISSNSEKIFGVLTSSSLPPSKGTISLIFLFFFVFIFLALSEKMERTNSCWSL